MPRESKSGTGFRRSQARAVLEGLLRTLAPRMVGRDSLRQVVRSLADDPFLWAELESFQPALHVHGRPTLPRPSPVLTTQIRPSRSSTAALNPGGET